MTTLEAVWRLLAVLLLVGANAFFVAAEFALVAAQDAKLARRAAGGDRLARIVRTAQKDLNLYLSSCQVGITLASLGLGWIGEPAIAQTLIAWFSGLPSPFDFIARHAVAVTIAFAIITYLHVVLGEMAPKAVAIFHPEITARWIIWPLIVFTRVGTPVIWSLNESANLLLRIFGVRLPTEAERVHSPEELRLLVRKSRESGVVEQDEQAMIDGVFDLTRTVAREVMTPRRDIVAVPLGVGFRELVEVASRSGHSRLPVYEGSLDNVVGIVLVKDLLPVIAAGGHETFDVGSVMREPYFVPDSKPVDDLLAEFRQQKIHIGIVVDEFGGTDGLVALEDLIEEIVGEIYDEYDVARTMFRTTAQGEALIDGSAPLDEVNERFGLSLPEEEYDTLAGFILGKLGKVPSPGDSVSTDDGTLVVENVDDRRVRLVRLLKATGKPGTGVGTQGARADSDRAAAGDNGE